MTQLRRVVARMFPIAVTVIIGVAASFHFLHGDPAAFRWFCTSGPLVMEAASALAIGHLVLFPRALGARFLSSRPLVWLGQRSYGLYLWHIIVLTFVRDQLGFGQDRVGWFVQIALSLVVAELSFSLIERPLRSRLGQRFRLS